MPGMMRRVRSGDRKPGESNVEFLTRIAIIDTIAGERLTPEPVIAPRRRYAVTALPRHAPIDTTAWS